MPATPAKTKSKVIALKVVQKYKLSEQGEWHWTCAIIQTLLLCFSPEQNVKNVTLRMLLFVSHKVEQ